MDAVDDVGGNVHRTLEAEGHVGTPQVVVDGFGQADNVDAVLRKQVCGLVGAVAAQNDQTVEFIFFAGFQHLFQSGLAAVFLRRQAHRFERLAGGSQNGTAQCQDARKIIAVHLADVVLNQSAVSVPHAIQLHIVAKAAVKGFCHTAQSGVESLAVAAAGQHCYFHKVSPCSKLNLC